MRERVWLSVAEEQVLRYITKHPGLLSQAQIAAKLKLSRRHVRRCIKRLVALGLIRAEGYKGAPLSYAVTEKLE